MMKTILLMAIAAIVGNCSNAQNDLKMTEKNIKIRNNEIEISYYQQGEGDTTLLFLHGWCINKTYWKAQFDYFSKDYQTLAIDLPGFGKSSAKREKWTIEEYAKDVDAFINSLNLKNVVLVGHSMSGEIMIQTAMLNNPKVIGLIGIDNFKTIDVVFTPEQMKQMTDFFPLLQNDFKNAAPMYADLMLFSPTTTTENKERVKTDIANSNAQIAYATIMNYIQFSSSEAQVLEQLNYKLNLINCDYFPTNEEGLQNHCKKGFNVEMIAHSGHYPMIEQADELNRLLEKTLKKGIY